MEKGLKKALIKSGYSAELAEKIIKWYCFQL
jgi:hypothetical protein